jgi:hypothetical protein
MTKRRAIWAGVVIAPLLASVPAVFLALRPATADLVSKADLIVVGMTEADVCELMGRSADRRQVFGAEVWVLWLDAERRQVAIRFREAWLDEDSVVDVRFDAAGKAVEKVVAVRLQEPWHRKVLRMLGL